VTGPTGRSADLELRVPGRIARRFHGRLDVTAADDELVPVVSMDLETAVASVVAAEQIMSAPPEALKAQAVAARSFFAAAGSRLRLLRHDALPVSPRAARLGSSRRTGRARDGWPRPRLSRRADPGVLLGELRRPDAHACRRRTAGRRWLPVFQRRLRVSGDHAEDAITLKRGRGAVVRHLDCAR
jgi:hypothetical protein